MNGAIAERLGRVRERLAAACARAGRDPAGVRIVAVAKTFGPEAVAEAAGAGLDVIGESRVQEAAQKMPLCPGHLEWHLVGHLQRNKAREAARLFRMVHSVDSIRLAEALDRACEEEGFRMPVCVEVNVAGEASKFGAAPETLREVAEAVNGMKRLDLRGLMTVPPFAKDPEEARPFFRKLRELRDSVRAETGIEMAELSMGMSDDFEVAAEEGATLVRLGAALFGARAKRAGMAAEGDAEPGGAT